MLPQRRAQNLFVDGRGKRAVFIDPQYRDFVKVLFEQRIVSRNVDGLNRQRNFAL